MAFRPQDFATPLPANMGLAPIDGGFLGRGLDDAMDGAAKIRQMRRADKDQALRREAFEEDRTMGRERLDLERRREGRLEAREATRELREQKGFDLKQRMFENEEARQKRLDIEAMVAKYWAARERGDQVAMEAAAQEMERAGFRVERPDFPGAPAEEPPPEAVEPGSDPTLGGTLQPTDDAAAPAAEPAPGERVVQAEGFDFTYPDEGTVAPEQVELEEEPTAPSQEPAPWLSRFMGASLPAAEEQRVEAARGPAMDRARAEAQSEVASLGPGYRGGLKPNQDPTAPGAMTGGGFRVFDENGEQILVDEMPHKDLLQSQAFHVTRTMEPLYKLAKDEEEKSAALEALQIGLGMVGSRPTKDIQEAMLNHFYKQTGEANKLTRAKIAAEGHARSGGSSIGGGTFADPKLDDKVDNRVNAIIEKVRQDRGFNAEFRKAHAVFNEAYQGMLSDDPARQNDAFRSLLEARSGKTVTEAEFKRYLDTVGATERFNTILNKYVGGGKVSNELRSGMARILKAGMSTADKRLGEAAEEAQDRVRGSTLLRGYLSPEELDYQVELAGAAFTGKRPKGAAPQRAGSKKGPQAGKGGGTDAAPRGEDASAEEL